MRERRLHTMLADRTQSLHKEPRAIRLRDGDSVAVVADACNAGTRVLGLVTRERIPRGHKVAIQPINAGDPVLKYGQFIGRARMSIEVGDHVHTHNLAFEPTSNKQPRRDASRETSWEAPAAATPLKERTFQGYLRAGGKVGTRNLIAVMTSVNCSATVAHMIADESERRGLLDDLPNVDGVVALTHGTGCGMSDKSPGYELLERAVWGTAGNPNIGGALLVGLGCEVFQLPRLRAKYGLEEDAGFIYSSIQTEGGTMASVEAGLSAVRKLAERANACQRTPQAVKHLVLGLQCGGSDGFSGITANPSLGAAADLIVAAGGTVILAETPEIYGAEHLLMARAASAAVSGSLEARVAWWREYAERHGATLDANPSPGNLAGGITTILEKSLGAVAKAGTSPLMEVIDYAAPAEARGFIFMDSPGYDPCSVTGQIASGANMIAFTTGRGSAFGAKTAPSVKLASTSDLYGRMREDMDVDCGGVLSDLTVAEMGALLVDEFIDFASGKQTKSEVLGYGRHEFVPWQIGAVL